MSMNKLYSVMHELMTTKFVAGQYRNGSKVSKLTAIRCVNGRKFCRLFRSRHDVASAGCTSNYFGTKLELHYITHHNSLSPKPSPKVRKCCPTPIYQTSKQITSAFILESRFLEILRKSEKMFCS